MKNRKMEAIRTAMLIAVFALTGLNTVFAQSTDWRDYLMSDENANSSYYQEMAQRRMAAVTDSRTKNITLPGMSGKMWSIGSLSRESEFRVRDMSGINVNQSYGSPTRYTGRSVKDAALEELDRMISKNWLPIKLDAAKKNYTFTAVSAEDKEIEKIVKKVVAARNPDAALKIMTAPPVSEKIGLLNGVSPETFVRRSRDLGDDDATITRAAMNMDSIIAISGREINNVMNFLFLCKKTPVMANSVLKKLVALGMNNHNGYYVLNMFLGDIIVGDLPNPRFMTTKQALEKIDVVAPKLQYELMRFVVGGGDRAVDAGDIYQLRYQFETPLKYAGFNYERYQNMLQSIGFTTYKQIAMIMIACQDNPSWYRNLLSWDQTTIDRVKQLDVRKDEDWAALKSILSKTPAAKNSESSSKGYNSVTSLDVVEPNMLIPATAIPYRQSFWDKLLFPNPYQGCLNNQPTLKFEYPCDSRVLKQRFG